MYDTCESKIVLFISYSIVVLLYEMFSHIFFRLAVLYSALTNLTIVPKKGLQNPYTSNFNTVLCVLIDKML